MKQIEPGQGARTDKLHDGADMKFTRTEAAKEAGLSERQKVTARSPLQAAAMDVGFQPGAEIVASVTPRRP